MLVFGLAVATPAVAAPRYASPGGAGTDCSQGAPCSLVTAVNGANAADDVIVASGDYDVGMSGVLVDKAISVHGIDGQSRPVIHSPIAEGAVITAMHPGASVRHLTVRQDASMGAVAVDAPQAAELSDLAAVSTVPNGKAVALGTGVVLKNSTALATGDAGVAVQAGDGASLHNVTAWATGLTGTGLLATSSAAAATNTIVRAPNGVDVKAEISSIVTITHSNYASTTGSITDLGGHQTDVPGLANTANGDFHQLRGSPTIDAGIANPASGLTDPDGQTRPTGVLPDIGADEFVPLAPTVTTGDPLEITSSGGRLTGTVNPNGLETTYHFDYGTTPLYGNSTPAASAGSGSNPVPVGADLTGLTPGTILHYRLVASSADGESVGLDRLLIVLAGATGDPGSVLTDTPGVPDVPVLTTLQIPVTVVAGQPFNLTAGARNPDAPVNSIRVDFGENKDYFIESACRLSPRDGAFRDGRTNNFTVPHSFATPGVYTVEVTLGSGECGRPGTTTSATVQVNVIAPQASRAKVIAAAGCKNPDLVPTKRNLKKVRTALICMLNEQRRANGLKPVRSNSKLAKAAKLHNTYMKRGKFFAHQGPREPSLAKRIRKYKYRGGAGENLAAGSGSVSSARGIVLGWMNSPVHRANMLERTFFTIGVDVMAQRPLEPTRPGATYTAEFGTLKK